MWNMTDVIVTVLFILAIVAAVAASVVTPLL